MKLYDRPSASKSEQKFEKKPLKLVRCLKFVNTLLGLSSLIPNAFFQAQNAPNSIAVGADRQWGE